NRRAHMVSGIASRSPRGGCVFHTTASGWGGLSYWRLPMITAAPVSPTRRATDGPCFESLLPSIQKCVAFAFRRLPRHRRGELEQDAITNAYVEFTRLIARGLGSLAYPTPLAKFAVRQVLKGRRVGCRQNAHDLSSRYCQSKNHIVLDRLHQQLA